MYEDVLVHVRVCARACLHEYVRFCVCVRARLRFCVVRVRVYVCAQVSVILSVSRCGFGMDVYACVVMPQREFVRASELARELVCVCVCVFTYY